MWGGVCHLAGMSRLQDKLRVTVCRWESPAGLSARRVSMFADASRLQDELTPGRAVQQVRRDLSDLFKLHSRRNRRFLCCNRLPAHQLLAVRHQLPAH